MITGTEATDLSEFYNLPSVKAIMTMKRDKYFEMTGTKDAKGQRIVKCNFVEEGKVCGHLTANKKD